MATQLRRPRPRRTRRRPVHLTFRASSTGEALAPTSHFTVVPDRCPDFAAIQLPERVDYAHIDPAKMLAEIEAFLASH